DLYLNSVPGDRVGPMHVLAGGNQLSIFQVDGSNLLPTVLLGDRLPGGFPFQGSNTAKKSPSGDLYVSADNATVRISSTGSSLVATYPYLMTDGVNLNTPSSIAVNDHNQVLIYAGTSASHSRLVLSDGTTIKTIAYFNGSAPYQTPSPGGGTFAGLTDY